MTTNEPTVPRWRVAAKGHSSAPTTDLRHLWAKGEMVNAHLWAETVVPNSEFAVEQYRMQRPTGDSVASVRLTVTVNAADAPEAESTVRLVFDEALPAVTFTKILAEEITGRYVAGGHSQPMCSFCGKTQRQVRTLIAGPGVYICDECVEAMAEIIHNDAPPPGG